MIAEQKLKNDKLFEMIHETGELQLSFWKKIALLGGSLILAFLLGLVPMWFSEREAAQQRDAAQANLRLSNIQNRLASAAINVRRGEYEEARLSASDFFTDLRAEIDRNDSALDAERREAIKPLLAQRDDLITLLARNDPATGDRLADLYINYLKVVNPALQKEKSMTNSSGNH